MRNSGVDKGSPSCPVEYCVALCVKKNRCLHSGRSRVLSFECAIQRGIRMHRTIPRVEGGRLFQSEREVDSILVGTPAWYDWLEQQSSFTFIDHALTFTARRTRGSYWIAYRKHQGKLYRIHLGHSHTLTLERLQAAAQGFAGKHHPGEQASMPRGSLLLPGSPYPHHPALRSMPTITLP